MDEIHYIGDDERGSVWEESIIFAPESVRFVGLSATISNLEQFRAWVEKVSGHQVDLVHTDERPVPLLHNVFVPEVGPCRISDLKEVIPLAKQRRKNRRFRRHDILDQLQREKKLPCLFFCFSRKECEGRARENQRRGLLGDDDARKVLAHFDDLGARYHVTGQRGFSELRQLASRGVLFHHAGMLPIYKEIVERLFTSGLIKLLFTTETFALGVNMPAKVVVFSSLRKFDGVGFDYLRTLNYYQMAGRAGRQGIDAEGTVYSIIDCDWDTPKDVKRVIFSKIEPIISKFNLSYAATLSLYGRMGPGIFSAVDRSFAAFQRGGSAQAERACGLEDSQKPLDFGLAAAVQAWMRGCRFEDLRNFTSTQDGDVVRNLRLAVQVLRQFAWAVHEHPELHERLLNSLAKLNRDEVDAEKQLTLG
jgi:superfamily II RNA helicase